MKTKLIIIIVTLIVTLYHIDDVTFGVFVALIHFILMGIMVVFEQKKMYEQRGGE